MTELPSLIYLRTEKSKSGSYKVRIISLHHPFDTQTVRAFWSGYLREGREDLRCTRPPKQSSDLDAKFLLRQLKRCLVVIVPNMRIRAVLNQRTDNLVVLLHK